MQTIYAFVDLLEVNETSWLSLDAGKCAIFGVVLKSIVSAGLHEFRFVTLNYVLINYGSAKQFKNIEKIHYIYFQELILEKIYKMFFSLSSHSS